MSTLPWNTNEEKLVKAKRLHQCEHCGYPITPKETYFRATWIGYEDGCMSSPTGFCTTKLHPECVKAYVEMSCREDGVVYPYDGLCEPALAKEADSCHPAKIAYQAAIINYTNEDTTI